MKDKARTKGTRARARDWRPLFLKAFAQLGTVSGAAKRAGVGRTAVYNERQKSETFALAWADIEQEVTDELEKVAIARAVDGSDRLIEFLLKARKPAVYAERQRLEHSGSIAKGEPVDVPSDDERAAEVARILADAGAVDE